MGLFDFFKKKRIEENVNQSTTNSNQAEQSFEVLVNQYAQLSSFASENKKKPIESQLLSGGNEALTAIMNYLLFCATGKQKEGWWNNARNLVRLIRHFSVDNHKILLNQLFQQNSNIAEYHREIKDVAEQELYSMKKENEEKDGTQNNKKISANDARTVLKSLDNLYDEKKRIDELNNLRNSVDDWNDNDKAFYYYLYAWPIERLFPNSKANLAYYAAQLFYDPDKLCIGWNKFSIPSSEYSSETAKKLHRQYPLPKNIEEMQNYKYE